jgi:hypothetical protein
MQYFVDYITMKRHYNYINNVPGVKQMIQQLIQQLPKYEQRHAANAVIHARNGNMLGIDAAIRCARTEKVKQIYLQIIKAL